MWNFGKRFAFLILLMILKLNFEEKFLFEIFIEIRTLH